MIILMKPIDGKTFSAYVRSKLHSGYITAVYNCKLLKLNFRCVLLITLLDTIEVKPRPKAHFEVACKLAVYSKAVVENL